MKNFSKRSETLQSTLAQLYNKKVCYFEKIQNVAKMSVGSPTVNECLWYKEKAAR